MRLAWLLPALLLAGCGGAAHAVTDRQRWVAVLVAGDDSIPVFDNATGQVAALLRQAGTPAADIHRLTATRDALDRPNTTYATKPQVLEAVAALRPAPGAACLVFITSHGAHGPGVYLAPHRQFVSPAELDGALRAGCGTAPTVAVVSACYTGDFSRAPMARANRIVLTAARADRPSFGCGAGRELAYYDQCLIEGLTSLPRDWQTVDAITDRCVTRLERAEDAPASDPQSSIGAQVAGLAVVGE